MKNRVMKNSGIQAICHDCRNLLSATLTRPTSWGCELVSNFDSASPLFPLRTRVYLHLLDDRRKISVNLLALLCGIKRKQGLWIYTIRWKQIRPDFLLRDE